MLLVRLEELLGLLRRAVQHHVDIAVARRPHIFEKLVALLLCQRSYAIAEFVERLAQWRTPELVERSSAIASAIRPPALHTVSAAPRCVLFNFAFILRGKLLQEHSVIRQL